MFDDIQQEAAARLASHPYLADLTIITEDKGDIEGQIRTALAKLGISITVLTVEADCDSPDCEPLSFDRVGVIVEVAEFVAGNRGATGTGKTIGRVCEAALQALSLYTSGSRTFTMDTPTMRMVDPPPPATACRHLKFRTFGELPGLNQQPVN